ncbi:MAG: helix-turn-helix domain-containing protein [Methylocella sp.]
METTEDAKSPEAPSMGLRERKAIKIRQRITDVAMILFRERGFDGVTLAEIAESAEVAPRTLVNYFGSKEALVFAWQDAGGDRLLQMIAARPIEEDAFTVAANAIHAPVQDMPHKEALSLARMIEETQALRARDQLKTNALEVRLADALRAREPDLPELDARLIAMIALGAFRVAQTLWLEGGGETKPGRYIEDAFARLRRQVARSIANPKQTSRAKNRHAAPVSAKKTAPRPKPRDSA